MSRISETRVHFEICVPMSDDSRMTVQLLVQADESEYLTVREMVPLVFPPSCPQRHINGDGSFCLGWHGEQDMRVIGRDSAAKWWNTLFVFLIKQRRANNSRRWPGEQWAHGHKAAANQWLTEEAARSLGEDFVTDLKLRKFRVEKINSSKRPSSLLKVFRNNVHIYSVWENFKQLTSARKPCLCKPSCNGKPKKIRSCGSHRESLVNLGIHLHRQELEEEKYIKSYASLKACCGTLDECPIKNISGVIA